MGEGITRASAGPGQNLDKQIQDNAKVEGVAISKSDAQWALAFSGVQHSNNQAPRERGRDSFAVDLIAQPRY